jgi:hypothetical protein
MKRDPFYIFIILALAVVVLLQRACNGPMPKPIIKIKIDTTYKVKDSMIPTYVPTYKVLHDTFSIPEKVDTSSVIKEYFAKYEYVDTIKLDSAGYVRVKDIISTNKIKSRDVYYNYKIPTITKEITTIIPPNSRTQVYVGLDARFNKTDILHSFGADILLKTKNDRAFGFNIGVLNNMTPYFGGTILWKIKLR